MSYRLSPVWLVIAVLIVLCGFLTGCDEQTSPTSEVVEETGQTAEKSEQITEKPAPEPEKTRPPRVSIITNMGEIVVELNPEKAPITVKNFLRYVNEEYYDGTIFHRVIPGFMIQGGGFDEDMNKKPTHLPIRNESYNGLKNYRGTIAMAMPPFPDSATSQFFINVKDNAFLDYSSPANPGYAVFGKVIEGMDVADKIVSVPRITKNGLPDNPDNPVEPVIIKSARLVPVLK